VGRTEALQGSVFMGLGDCWEREGSRTMARSSVLVTVTQTRMEEEGEICGEELARLGVSSGTIISLSPCHRLLQLSSPHGSYWKWSRSLKGPDLHSSSGPKVTSSGPSMTTLPTLSLMESLHSLLQNYRCRRVDALYGLAIMGPASWLHRPCEMWSRSQMLGRRDCQLLVPCLGVTSLPRQPTCNHRVIWGHKGLAICHDLSPSLAALSTGGD
jgi:hypothetical protein